MNVVGSPFNTTDTQPVALTVDPALGRFVYTANELGNSVSGFRLNATSGSLSLTQSTPYPTGSEPTALIAVPHGTMPRRWWPDKERTLVHRTSPAPAAGLLVARHGDSA